jgi:hypothetical protein
VSDLPEAQVRVTQYEVSRLPLDDEAAHGYTITVEYRGRGKWGVLDGRYCLAADGSWEYEMRPSEREDDWLARHRFDLETALELAKTASADMTVNGRTVADALAWIKARDERTSNA